MPVPVEWLGNFQINTGAEATGGQSDPQIIGLANGNILVVWTEAADGAIGGGQAGTDIIGKIYDAEGNVVEDALRLNSVFSEDERDFDIAATSDGGFVMAYLSAGMGSSLASSVVWERYDIQGHSTDLETVESELSFFNFLANPHVAVDLQTNQSLITYTDDVGSDTDVRGKTVSGAGVLGTEFDAAQNSADFDGDADVAVLSNGNYVSVHEEANGAVNGGEFRIMNSSGVFQTSLRFISSATNDPKVASLAGGGFVVAFETPGNSGDVAWQIYDGTGSFVDSGFAASGADSQNEAEIVALPDGDFVIVWDNDTDDTLEGQRVNADGSSDGGVFVIEAAGVGSPQIGVTGDGRLLFTWLAADGAGEIVSSIWDPREGSVNAGDYDTNARNFVNAGIITGAPGATTINGDGRAGVTLIGQAGADTITGGDNSQTIHGGGGDDSILGGESAVSTSNDADLIDGGAGFDTIIGAAGNDTIIGGFAADSIDGGGGDDSLVGGFVSDTVFGGGGNDTISVLNGEFIDNVDGGLGLSDLLDLGDIVNPGEGVVIDADTNSFTGLGGVRTFNEIERVIGTALDDFIRLGLAGNIISGGGGDDTIEASFNADSLNGDAGNDVLEGGIGFDTVLGGAGFDVIRLLDNDQVDDVDGGADIDTLDLSAVVSLDQEVNIDLGAGSFTAFGGTRSIAGIEIVLGTQGDDTLTAGAIGVLLDGDGGDDELFGGVGADTLHGGGRKDLVFGGGGGDSISGGNGFDELHGQNGDDAIDGAASADSIFGGAGDDSLNGGDANDTLNGGAGADALNGGGGLDWADYSDAALKVRADLQIPANNSNDAAGDAYISIENLRGTALNDVLRGDPGANILDGGDKNDKLDGRGGDDTLIGGKGSDTLIGRAGADELRFADIGVGGPDRVVGFTAGEDVIALKGAIFGLAPGALDPNVLVFGSVALDADDRLIYKPGTGKLFFDPDGAGSAAQIHIATIVGSLALTASDFLVI